MPLTNTVRPQVDLPIWEWCSFLPAVTSALSSTASANNSNYNPVHGRYLYLMIAAASFWRYDTWYDTYEQLSSPPVATATYSALEFHAEHGFEGRVLGAGSASFTAPAYSGQALKGYDVRILSGTGAGQRRIVTAVSEPTVAATGVATAVGNVQGAITITDALAAWTINQWVGYQVRISFGSGVGQVRKVLYNSATVLTLGDSTKIADDYLANPGIYSPTISATAGSQSIYSIESSVVTVDTAWDTQPDTTSRFRLSSGGIFLTSSAAAAPFFTIQTYDIVTDTWYIKTSGANIIGVVGAEGSTETAGEASCVWDRGNAGGTNTTTTLQDLTQGGWTVNQWAGYWLFIFSGTQRGSIRKITSNTANTLTWSSALGAAPDSTSQYFIWGYTAGTATSGAAGTLTDTTQAWTTNQWTNYSVRIIAGTGIGQSLPIASNTATVLTLIRPWATAPDSTSVYVVSSDQDKIYGHTSGSAAFFIQNIDDDLTTLGRLIDSGTARQGSASVGSFKAQALTSITFVTTTATVTTANSHNFAAGQSVTISGATGADAAKYNGTFTITAVASNTTFTYTMGSTPAANAIFTGHSTTTLTDSTKSWTTNQWAGFLVTLTSTAVTAATGAATEVTAVIASNTATTLTFATTTAPTNGVSRWAITSGHIIGTNSATEFGVATSGSTTTIVDTTKTWVVNVYAGRRVKFVGGSGQGQEGIITANTATTLTFTALTTAAAANTAYAIMQQAARGTGAALAIAWNATPTPGVPNSRYMYIARGGGTVGFDRIDLTTDTVTLLSIAPQLETLTAGSQFAYDGVNRLYFSKIDATAVQQRLYYLDLTTYMVHGAGFPPYVIPTAVVSNRMEIFTTADNLNFLWLNRQSFQEVFRLLLAY